MERNQLTLSQKLGNFLPLLLGEVGAGWIVTTAVEQENISLVGGSQRLAHIVKQDCLPGQIKEWILDHFLP